MERTKSRIMARTAEITLKVVVDAMSQIGTAVYAGRCVGTQWIAITNRRKTYCRRCDRVSPNFKSGSC